jgi:peroxiredoxin
MTTVEAQMGDRQTPASVKRLIGQRLPSVKLSCTTRVIEHELLWNAPFVSLADIAHRSALVVYFFTSADCVSTRHTVFRRMIAYDRTFSSLEALTVGISTQAPWEQRKFCDYGEYPPLWLSDHMLKLANAMELPIRAAGARLEYESLTMIAREEHIAQIFYPIDKPADHMAMVLKWLIDHRS